MANDITGKIKIDAKSAAKELEAIDKQSKETGESVEGIGTKGQVMARILNDTAASVEQDLADAKRMADLLSNALGPELTAKLNTDGKLLNIVDDLRRVGLTADDVEVDIDQLAASIKRLDDSATSVRNLETEMGRVRNAQDRVTEGSNMNRSVIANFAGNAAQELPGVTNAFGPLNMAISQAVEYGAEGNIAFKQMLTAGLAMGGVAAVIQVVGASLESMAATKAFNSAQVDEYKESIKELEDPLTMVLDNLREAAAIEFRQDKWNGAFGGLLQETEDITDEMFALGLTAEDFAQGVVGGADGLASFIEQVRGRFADTADGATIDVERSMEAQRRIIEAVEQAASNYGRALTEAEIEEAVFAATTAETSAKLVELDDRAEGVATALDNAAAAADREEAQARRNIETTERLTEEYKDQKGRIDDLIRAKTQLVGGEIAVRQAMRDAKTASDELNTSIAEGTIEYSELGPALDDAVTAQMDAAQAAADYEAAQLRANGSTVDAQTEAFLYKQELQKLADQATGPTRDALLALIAQLDEVARDRTATVNIEVLQNGQRVNLGGGSAIGGGIIQDGPDTGARGASVSAASVAPVTNIYNAVSVNAVDAGSFMYDLDRMAKGLG